LLKCTERFGRVFLLELKLAELILRKGLVRIEARNLVKLFQGSLRLVGARA
jgi:hypothetical protein